MDDIQDQGEEIDDETLSHMSLRPYKHVLVHGTYFKDEDQVNSLRKVAVSTNGQGPNRYLS